MRIRVRQNLVTLLVFVTAFVVGIVLGANRDRPSQGRDEEGRISERGRLSSLAGAGTKYTSPAVAKAAEIDGYGEEFEVLLRQMPVGDFPEMASMLLDRYSDDDEMRLAKNHLFHLMEVWAERDPSAALVWYETQMPREFDHYQRRGLFLGWGRSDPEAALAYIEVQVSGLWADDFAVQVLMGASDVDPELAIRLLEGKELRDESETEIWRTLGFSIGRNRPEMYDDLIARWRERPKGGNPMFRAMLSGIEDERTLKELLGRLTEEERQEVLRYDELIKRLTRTEVAEMEPEAFLDHYTSRLESDPVAAGRLLQAMLDTQPVAMLELMISQPDVIPENFYTTYAQSLVDGYGGLERTRSLLGALLRQGGANNQQVSDALEVFAKYRYYSDALYPPDWLEGEARRYAAAGYVRGIAGRSVEDALEMYSELDAETRRMVGTGISENWALRDVEAAVEWIEQSGEEIDQTAARAAILPQWASNDPGAASEWVAALPVNSPERDSHIAGLVRGLEQGELIDEALEWFNAIEDWNLRESLRMELRDGMSEAEFESEFEEVQGELQGNGEEFTPEKIELYRQLYFGER